MADLGHEVVVANPRQVALIARSQRKTDRLTPHGWRGWGASTRSCSPRSATEARRASMTSPWCAPATRWSLADAAHQPRRGAVKACGAALPSCTAAAFQRKAAEHIPDGLRPALCRWWRRQAS